MTKEELKKEAEENSFRYTLDKPWACEVERKQIMAHFEKAYLAGAEPREKRIEELEAQIEKMECCGNCVHFDFTEPNYCHKGVYRANQKVCGEWCFGN